MKAILRPLFVLAFAAVTVWSFLVPDALNFQHPELARIFFWHFPCPMLLIGFMFAGIYCSLRVFRRLDFPQFSPVLSREEKRRWDVSAESAMELGFLYAVLTMISGIIFSKVEWGAWWQADPRQTSFLLALLIYGAYFALRSAFADPDKRAEISGAYALSAAVPIVFLVLVYPRLPQVAQQSSHPTDTIMSGQLHGGYAQVVWAVLILTTILSIWVYKLRVRAGLLELGLEDLDGQLEIHSGRSAGTAVVRPVSLPSESGP